VRQWSITRHILRRALAGVGLGFPLPSSPRVFLILGPVVMRQMRKIRGPVVPGTAEVLSLRRLSRPSRSKPTQTAGAGQVSSAAASVATGQRVPAALKSFALTGTTPRSPGRTPNMPDLSDAPHYILAVELHFPNLASIAARAVQPVLIAQVPNLAIGLPMMCAVDPADPLRRFVVDWQAPQPLS
jgi:hypothetical protein